MPFEIVFPSQETFLMAETGSVSVYVPVDDTPDEICRNLSSGLPAGDGQNSATTGSIDICSFLGDVELTGVSPGRVVFFAEVRGGPDRGPILSGCTVADIDTGTTEPVRIQLSTLPTYPELEVICANIDAKCPDDGVDPAQCIPE